MAAPGRSGDRQPDRPSVRLPRLPLGARGHRCGDEMENRAGKGGEMGLCLSAELGAPARSGRGDSRTTLGPFWLDVTGTVGEGGVLVPDRVEVTDSGD